jgi:hypothetical protein
MDFVVEQDLGNLLRWAAGLGALGGLAWDVLEPIRIAKEATFTGFENKVTLPRFLKGSWSLDWGFLGPMLVGAVAGVAAVFLIAVSSPSEPTTENVTNLSERLTQAGVSDEIVAELDLGEPAPASAERAEVIWMALVAGFAGPAVLRALRTRLVDLVNSVALRAAHSGAQAAAAEATAAVREGDLASNKGPAETAVLLDAIETRAVRKAMSDLTLPG